MEITSESERFKPLAPKNFHLAVEKVVCNLCGGKNLSKVASGTDREYYTCNETFTVDRCNRCDLMFLNPRPRVEELSRIYPSTYHSYVIDTDKNKPSFLTQLRHRAHIKRCQQVLSYLPKTNGLEILDVGCGDGWILELFQRASEGRIKASGVEIDPVVCEKARRLGHDIYCGRIEDVQIDRQFDLLNYNHVIEHVSDPKSVTRKSHQLLKRGGLLIYETPNADTVDWKWFKRSNWGAYHFPRHWYFFSAKTLQDLVCPEGFELVDLYYHPAPTHWVWTLHNVSLESNSWLGRLGQRIFNPTQIFHGGIIPFLTMAVFTIVDKVIIGVTGRSSVMTAVFRKI